MIGRNAPPNAATMPMSFQLMPARKITNIPELAISRDVPKSGCFAMSIVGTTTSTKAMTICDKVGGIVNLLIYQAIIIGTASFMASEG